MTDENLNEAPVLTNRYRFNEETLRNSFQQLMRPMMIFQLAIALAVLVMAVWFTVRYAKLFSQGPQLILMIAVLYLLAGYEFWSALTSAKRSARRTIKRIEESYQIREYDVILRFEPEALLIENSYNAESNRLPYDSIRKLKRMKDLIAFRTQARRVFTLDPARFENGTEADFWRLMNEKCSNAVPKELRT